jgi:hypothetical protein
MTVIHLLTGNNYEMGMQSLEAARELMESRRVKSVGMNKECFFSYCKEIEQGKADKDAVSALKSEL